MPSKRWRAFKRLCELLNGFTLRGTLFFDELVKFKHLIFPFIGFWIHGERLLRTPCHKVNITQCSRESTTVMPAVGGRIMEPGVTINDGKEVVVKPTPGAADAYLGADLSNYERLSFNTDETLTLFAIEKYHHHARPCSTARKVKQY